MRLFHSTTLGASLLSLLLLSAHLCSFSSALQLSSHTVRMSPLSLLQHRTKRKRLLGSKTTEANGVPSPNTAVDSSLLAADATAVEASTAATNSDAPLTKRAWTFTRTKQVVTLGPVSSNFEMIEQLFLNGADVFRLNFSHGKREDKTELVKIIRLIEQKWNHPLAILADLQGPKLRVGVMGDTETKSGEKMTGAAILEDGQLFRLDLDKTPGDTRRINLPHPEIVHTLGVGDVLLLDDGKLRMNVVSTGPSFVECVVEVGGRLSSAKGVNTPTVTLPISAMSEKDKKDAVFARDMGVDWIALSFVQRGEDMIELRELVGDDIQILAKIEKPQAVDRLDDIVKVSDGIMVARGDLGVEMDPSLVPVLQKRIVEKCRSEGVPVIVATQMLESMITAPTPTRAEASDVATAIYDGADAVMLSAESAAGKYPIETTRIQRRIIESVESDPQYRRLIDASVLSPRRNAMLLPQAGPTDIMTIAARQVANLIGAKAIVVFTLRGTTVHRASKGRPPVPVIAITPDVRTARALQLHWGVYPVADSVEVTVDNNTGSVHVDEEAITKKACDVAVREGLANPPNDTLVITAGLPFGTPGATNFLRVVQAGGPRVWTVDDIASRRELLGHGVNGNTDTNAQHSGNVFTLGGVDGQSA